MASLLKKVWNKHQHGLLLHAILRNMRKVGLGINPYYLVQEGVDEVGQPEFRGNPEEYTFEFLDPAKIEELNEILGESREGKPVFLRRMEQGKKCICLKHNGHVIACMWFELEECRYFKPLFKLGKNEAYLFDMYTLNSYRGRNIAPYLRYKSYEILREMGRDTLYSISEYFNSSAVKFKKKLNARFLGIYLFITLFKKWKWHFKIREYKF